MRRRHGEATRTRLEVEVDLALRMDVLQPRCHVRDRRPQLLGRELIQSQGVLLERAERAVSHLDIQKAAGLPGPEISHDVGVLPNFHDIAHLRCKNDANPSRYTC